jgi:hypothetical protein
VLEQERFQNQATLLKREVLAVEKCFSFPLFFTALLGGSIWIPGLGEYERPYRLTPWDYSLGSQMDIGVVSISRMSNRL